MSVLQKQELQLRLVLLARLHLPDEPAGELLHEPEDLLPVSRNAPGPAETG